nr:phage protein Gp37 [Neisseria sp. HSC-16F19]
MVTGVHAYGGELDDEGLYQVVQQMPAVWVTFGGIGKTEPVKTNRNKHTAHAKFVVMVAAKSYRSEAASRAGGVSRWEIGSYDLLYAVRRLLANQDLGLSMDALQPGAVRTLFNGRLERAEAMSVFACEFSTHWIEEALPNGRWPEIPQRVQTDPASGAVLTDAEGQPLTLPDVQHPDYVFADYSGATSAAEPYLTGVRLHVHRHPGPKTEAELSAEVPTQF